MDYDKKKEHELAWHEKGSNKQNLITRLLRSPVFYTPKRNSFNYRFPKQQMAEVLQRHLKGKHVQKMLLAPCGSGGDLEFVSQYADEMYGIDLSPIATAQCPSRINVTTGDILSSGYPDGTFDVIVSSLFFHHLLNVGFDPFLREFHRILKPGGILVILEPSLWYPLNIITRPLKKIFRNPYGEVEDEGPFHPGRLTKSLHKQGFQRIETQAATFSHCSFYIPFAKGVNIITEPLLKSPLKYLGWMVVFYAERKE